MSARALLLLALSCLACAPAWTVRTAPAPSALQWPPSPAGAKLTFVQALTGFTPRKGPRSALRAVVYGKDRDERHAFLLPVAVARGADGRIAVADLGCACVHLYIPERQRYLRLSGGKGGKLISPVAVTFDDELRLWVSDSAGRVLGFDAVGEPVLTLERAGTEPLRRPTGLAYSPRSKVLYIVDTLAHRVHAFGTRGELAFSFGERGEELGQFNFPTHIFRSAEGELYVTDALAFRIEIFDEQGEYRASFGRHGDGSGDLALPKGVAVDRDGVVYVVDGLFDNVQLFNRRGDFLLTLGGRGVELGEFWLPTGAFVSDDGELYVCDTYNRRIQVFRIAVGYGETAS